MGFIDYIKLIRIRQWYKNLVIFLPIFFLENIFNTDWLIPTLLGFLSLCFVSSGNYVLNDIIDLKKDRLHPEKRNRPLASGKVHLGSAIFLAAFLLVLSFLVAGYLSRLFLIVVLGMFLLTQLYSLFLKNILFADLLTISALFVIRAISGAFIIDVTISPWLILCPFFLALFLAVGKRHADLLLLKGKASQTRKVLKDYTLTVTNHMLVISTTSLIISYALYSFLSDHKGLIYTLPFALFVVLRYFYLIDTGSEIARHPEKAVKDLPMVIGSFILVLLVFLIIYF